MRYIHGPKFNRTALQPFYPILDTEVLNARRLSLTDAAQALLRAGVRLLQLRHKGRYTRDLFNDAEGIAMLCRETGAAFVINDRADIALLLDAGLHVGQDDLAPADARRVIGDSRTLGFSTHNEEQFRAALLEPVDYIAFGPVFATASKRNPDPVAGVEQLRRMRSVADRPLVAIGGITRANVEQVFASGAGSVAVIGDLYPDPLTAASLEERAREWVALAHS